MLHTFLIVLGLLLALVGLFSLGFAITPRPFRPHPAPSQPGPPLPLRPDLPEPVRRHFAETIGQTPPEIHSAVVWGRGRACIHGMWVTLRFRAWFRPGEDYFRRIAITWFQRPVLRGSDWYINGQGAFILPGQVERGPRIDQAQFLTLWASAVWFPSVLVHDPRIRWEPVDEVTARLVVPYQGGSENLLAHFDPLTGRMTHLTGLRYGDEPEKEPWRVDLLEWKAFNGLLIPSHTSDAWGETGSPWAYWSLDGLAYNVNVSDQLGEEKELNPDKPG